MTDFEKTYYWLKEGKVIVVNCDTVYGLVSLDQTKIYSIKQRPLKKN